MKTITINQLDLNELATIIQDSVREAVKSIEPNKSAKLDYYLTRTEVAKLLKVSRQTLATWATSCELPCIKVGHHYRYRRDTVEAFMNSKELN